MLLLDLPGKLYKHRYNFFLFGPASSRFFPTSDGYFPTPHNKNETYENAVAPTDFVTKAVAWFWLDNFDSQTFHSWVGFAELIRGPNKENSSILAGVPYRDPPAFDLLALHALVFPLSFPFGRLPRRLETWGHWGEFLILIRLKI